MFIECKAVPTVAQISFRQPYEVCEPQLLGASAAAAIHRGFYYPAWNSARFNPADDRQIAALRSELDSSGAVRRHLYVLGPATRRPRQLVRDVGCALAWSRTGWLAFEQAGQLWKIRADGTGRTRLTSPATPSVLPAWSPDGQQLACLQAEGTDQPAYGIALLSTAGQLVGRLPLGKVMALGAPAWSPDGQRIAFLGGPLFIGGGPSGIYEFDLKTRRTRLLYELSRPRSWTYSLQWLAGGREILWRDGDTGLVVVNLAARTQRLAWKQDFLMSQDVDRRGRVLVVHTETRLDPHDPTRRSNYLVTELLTARLNGAGRVYLKPE